LHPLPAVILLQMYIVESKMVSTFSLIYTCRSNLKDATFLFYSLHTFLLINQMHVADMRLLFPEREWKNYHKSSWFTMHIQLCPNTLQVQLEEYLVAIFLFKFLSDIYLSFSCIRLRKFLNLLFYIWI